MHTIGKAAARAGVGIDTVRFYERTGLLKKAARTRAGYRLYDEDDIARLRFIRRAKLLGFSLQEIAELLALNDGIGLRKSVRAITAQRLKELDSKIKELERMRHTLSKLLGACHGDGPLPGCPIIEALLDEGVTSHACPPSQRNKRHADSVNK